MSNDPLRRQPRPVTGRRSPAWDDATVVRVAAAKARFATIWIDHQPQNAVIGQLRVYRLETLGRRGVPLNGRRLSEFSQAGKSATMARLKRALAEERAAQGLAPNDMQVIHMTITKRLTLKQFYQELLHLLKDPFYAERTSKPKPDLATERADKRDLKVLERRIAEFVVRLGVELIIIDEAQRLDRVSEDAADVTTRIQTWLDNGVAPLVLVGDEDSEEFFRKNAKLAVRLGAPLRLSPLRRGKTAERKLFKKFCSRFDAALVGTGACAMPSGLDGDDMLEALLAVSGGHVGRVARLLEEAVPMAVARGAACVEAFDLSTATRSYAMANGWVEDDPFSGWDQRKMQAAEDDQRAAENDALAEQADAGQVGQRDVADGIGDDEGGGAGDDHGEDVRVEGTCDA